jgi:hypothetical protein
MSLSHLLVPLIQADRETAIARQQLALEAASLKPSSAIRGRLRRRLAWASAR